ncbi:hypothetical protein D9M71_679820 [compost metagenome]
MLAIACRLSTETLGSRVAVERFANSIPSPAAGPWSSDGSRSPETGGAASFGVCRCISASKVLFSTSTIAWMRSSKCDLARPCTSLIKLRMPM